MSVIFYFIDLITRDGIVIPLIIPLNPRDKYPLVLLHLVVLPPPSLQAHPSIFLHVQNQY